MKRALLTIAVALAAVTTIGLVTMNDTHAGRGYGPCGGGYGPGGGGGYGPGGGGPHGFHGRHWGGSNGVPPAMVERMFANHDANQDGTITRDEMLQGPGGFLLGADTDKDGRVSREEMKARILQQVETRLEQKMQRMDRDGDGYVDMDQATNWRLQRFNHLDRNQDGKLTRDELTAQVAGGNTATTAPQTTVPATAQTTPEATPAAE